MEKENLEKELKKEEKVTRKLQFKVGLLFFINFILIMYNLYQFLWMIARPSPFEL